MTKAQALMGREGGYQCYRSDLPNGGGTGQDINNSTSGKRFKIWGDHQWDDGEA